MNEEVYTPTILYIGRAEIQGTISDYNGYDKVEWTDESKYDIFWKKRNDKQNHKQYECLNIWTIMGQWKFGLIHLKLLWEKPWGFSLWGFKVYEDILF